MAGQKSPNKLVRGQRGPQGFADRAWPPPSHGLDGYKHYGCRCRTCTRANTGYKAELRARKAKAAA